MNQKLFSKDFTFVVIGQIISLFGNAALRFALPLYLLNQTGSSALYGTVMACAFIPSILLSPVGGIVADRVNKRNVMVILDFFTAALILTFCLLMDGVNLVVLLTAS
ncbi:MAG: MFS transporter, partial [Lachnospiraceae bacterium]|nr:MFS transporter [Lachnospiraceae bacterium]